jgi:hypothetical protein
MKSYEQFVNENLIGQYSYYGQGSLFPIVSKLANEGKSAQQIYLYLTSLGIDEERKRKVISQIFLNESKSIDFDKIAAMNEGLFEDDDDIDDLVNADPKDLEKGIDPAKAKPDKDVKAALDKLEKGDKEEDDEEKPEDDVDQSSKVAALQSALKDAKKLEQIKKILVEAYNEEKSKSL